MKIVIIGPAHPLRGGIADTNESLCRAFLKEGHEAQIFSFSLQYPEFLFPGKTQFSTEGAPENIEITTKIHSLNPLNWLRVAQKINAIAPDVVVVRYWLSYLAPCLGSIARMLDVRIKIVGMTDNIIPHEKRFGDAALTNYFIGGCDAFVCLSSAVLKELKEFTDKPSLYLQHPINDNLGAKMTKTAARKALNLKENGHYLLFFGLVRRYKGLDLLLEALADERLQDTEIELIVAGEFYDKVETYTDFIAKNGLKNRVHIRNEYIPLEAVRTYFSAVDLCTQTYHSASQSGITQMAYHFDCPMLVTDVGALSEFVLHEKTGYVVPKNPTEIADAILRFFEQKKYAEFAENVAIEKQKYSWSNFVKRLLSEL